MNTKDVAFELKVSEEGVFEGLASTYNNIDAGNDMVMPGAFSEDLHARGSRRPLLWGHDTKEPIGFVDLTDTPRGLVVKGRLLIDGVPQARTVYELLKARVVSGLSIGYETIKHKYQGSVRQLISLKLFEVSAVTFPMNPLATVGSVKADEAALERLHQALATATAGLRSDAEAGEREDGLADLLGNMKSLRRRIG